MPSGSFLATALFTRVTKLVDKEYKTIKNIFDVKPFFVNPPAYFVNPFFVNHPHSSSGRPRPHAAWYCRHTARPWSRRCGRRWGPTALPIPCVSTWGVCFEPFSGSGSQIMAGEATGRRPWKSLRRCRRAALCPGKTVTLEGAPRARGGAKPSSAERGVVLE